MLGFLSLLGRKHAKKHKSCSCKNSCTKSVKSHKERELRIENLEQRQLLSITWNGQGNNNHWSNGANWAGGVAPTANADLVFSGATQTATENDLSYTFHSLTVSTSNFSVSGNPVALNGNLTLGSSVVGTSIPTGIGFSGSSSTVTLGSGANLTVGGISGASGLTLTTGSSSNLTVNGGVSVQGALTVTEGTSANLSVSGNVSATGNLTLTEGTSASFTVAGSISGTGNVAITEGSSASLSLGGINDTGTLTLTEGSNATATIGGIISGLSGITWNVGTGANATLSGDVSGTGGLTKTGPGMLTLSGHNSFSGTTTISTGTLKLTASDALAGSTLAYASTGGTLDLGTLTSVALGGLSGNKNLTLTNSNSQAIALSVGGDNASTSYSGVLSGLGSLTKTGDGALTLAGASANTFTGMTTVSAGKLVLGKSAGHSAFGGDLTICPSGGWDNGANGVELAANEQIPNTAALHFTGSDWSGFRLKGFTETVAGLDSPDGMGVIENYGMGETGPANDGTLIVNTPSAGNYAFKGYVRDNDSGSTKINLTKTGLGTQSLIGDNITYSGGTTVNAGTLRLQRTTGFQSAVTNSGTVELFSDDDFSNRGNSIFYQPFQVIGGVVNKTGPGEVRFAQAVAMSGQLNILAGVLGNDCLTADWSADTANVNIGSGAFLDLRGQPITVNALTGAGTVENTFNTGDANALTVGVNGSGGTFSGVILGSGQGTDDGDANMGITSLVKTGSGTLTLASSDSTFAGDLRVAGGTLKFDDVNALANATLDWNNYGGTLDLGHFTALTLGGLKGSQNFAMVNDLGQPITLTLGSGDYSGVLSGGGSLVKNGPGTLRLSGSTGNTYTGSTTFLDGYLELAKTSGYAILGDLSLGGAGDSWVKLMGDNQIAPTAHLTWTYTGGSHEIDLLGHDLTVAGISDTHGWGVIANTWDETGDYGDATFTLLNSADCSFNGYCRGSFLGDGTITVVKDGPGTLTLGSPNFDNTFTDDLKIAGGTVRLGDANALAHIMLDHNNFGGTLDLGNFTTVALGGLKGSQNFPLINGLGQPVALSVGRGDYAGVFSGAGSLTKTGDGILTLTGQNTYTGGTTIVGGGLQLGDGTSSNGSVVGDITNNANLIFAVSVDRIYSNVISGKGDLTKIGSGALTLTGANSYGGATIINEGTLYITDDESLGAGPVIDNAAFIINNNTPGVAVIVLGSGTLTLAGTSDVILKTPGTPTVTIIDPNHHVLAGGLVSLTAPTVMVGMPLTLTAAVADYYGECQTVSFYVDANHNGQLDDGDTFLAAGTNQNGYWSATVDTTGWSPSTATGFTPSTETVFARATFSVTTNHPPASTVASSTLNVTGDAEWAIVTSAGYPNSSGYSQSGPGTFNTVTNTSAYNQSYQLTSSSAPGTYATYIFSGLAPGNYEVWDQFVANSTYANNVTINVYDGSTTTTPLQTFQINEQATSNWPDWTFKDQSNNTVQHFGWSGNSVYSNTGTIIVQVDCSAANTEAPTICLVADPESRTSYAPGTLGGPEVTSDPSAPANGEIQPCSCVASAPVAANYSNVYQTLVETIFGYGRLLAYPMLCGDGMFVSAVNLPGSGSCTCRTNTGSAQFLEPDRNYTPLNGTKYTLVETQINGAYKLILTAPDGSICQFAEPADGQAYATGQWEKTTSPGGETTTVSQWVDADNQTIAEAAGALMGTVEYYESASSSHPIKKERFHYISSGANRGLCDSITYLRWDPSANGGNGGLVYDSMVSYTYYGDGSTQYGLAGDMESIVTQYPVGIVQDGDTVTWAGNDTYYFRYYTQATYDGSGLTPEHQIGFAHGLMRELLPAAYSSLANKADPNGTPAHQFSVVQSLPDSALNAPSPDSSHHDADITAFTCFYYQYDHFDRLKSESVFGKLRSKTFDYYEGSNVQDPNVWARRTTETRLDNLGNIVNTYIVYTNYLGQTILNDLCDYATGQHTYQYYEYYANGDPKLQAPSSAITDYWEGGTGDYHIHLSLPTPAQGPVKEYTYDSASGYLQSVRIANGLSPVSNNSYYNNTSQLLESRTYTSHVIPVDNNRAHDYKVYELASDTAYNSVNATTSYSYPTWYMDNSQATAQPQSVVTTLPTVYSYQNGSGEQTKTVDFYDRQGNVIWSKDARGFLTRYIYDSVSGLLLEAIADASTAGLTGLPTDPTTGLTLATPAGGGENLVTDYAYDNRDRLVQTLGPIHTDDTNTPIRTASWIIYDDAKHTTYSLLGFASQNLSGQWVKFTLVNPVSIRKTNADGQVNDDIQAVMGTGTTVTYTESNPQTAFNDFYAALSSDLATLVQTRSSYTALTHYTYSHKQLASVQKYYDLTGTGQYDETKYGYDPEGRLEWTRSPGGTITWNVLDARGLTRSTWVGTDDVPNNADGSGLDINYDGASDWHDLEAWLWYNESSCWDVTGLGCDLVKRASYDYDADGNCTKYTQYVDASTTRESNYVYDSRDRLIMTINPADDQNQITYSLATYDNLNEVIKTQQYWYKGSNLLNAINSATREVIPAPLSSTDKLLSQKTVAYDVRGRAYQTKTYSVDITQNPSAIGSTPLTSNIWYDAAGNAIKLQAAGSQTFTKTTYDGLGRPTIQYVGYDANETTGDLYTGTNLNLSDDTVYQQAEYAYDDVSNLIFVTNRQNDNDSLTNVLNIGNSRSTFVAYWQDALGRQTTIADYGTNGGTAPSRPATAPLVTFTGALVSKKEYIFTDANGDNRLEFVIKNDSITSTGGVRADWTIYDPAGRVVETVQNYDDGFYSSAATSQDIVTKIAYNADGLVKTQTDTLNHVTTYDYGTTLADNGVARSDLLVKLAEADPDGDLNTTGDVPVTKYTYDRLGETLRVKTTNDTNSSIITRNTTYAYDALGRQTLVAQRDLSDNILTSTSTVYDVRGNVYSTTDARGHGTTNLYDKWNRLASQTDVYGHQTKYTYNDNGTMETLIDADGNTTKWLYDRLNRVATESDQVTQSNPNGLSRSYTYAGGLLVQIVDRDDRVTRYAYDQFGRQWQEYWYPSLSAAPTDPTANISANKAYTYSYDCLGNLDTVKDGSNQTVTYDYDYDALSRATTIKQNLTCLSPQIEYIQGFDGNGNRQSLSTKIGDTNDFVNDYQYDYLGRMTRVQQHDVAVGDDVTEKRVDFAYDASGQFSTINRYASLYDPNHPGNGKLATSDYTYDSAARLTGLIYSFSPSSTDIAPGYHWSWDNGNRITDFYSRSDMASGSTDPQYFTTWAHSQYTNDDTNQLTGASYYNWTHTPDSGTESYTYDNNGNRKYTGVPNNGVGPDNQLANDGTYHYDYDPEGNRTQRYKGTDSDGNGKIDDSEKTDITDYTWDNRNRLTDVVFRQRITDTPDWSEHNDYDYLNRLVRQDQKQVQNNSTVEKQTVNVYDGNQIALQFETTDAGNVQASNLAHRLLWGPAVDQILADEAVSTLSSQGQTRWTLTDNLNTVRDLATYSGGPNGTTSVVDYRVFDAFGRKTYESDSTYVCHIYYTGKLYDTVTCLQNNLNRWYEPATGKWISRDPIESDNNYYAYVLNCPMNLIDPQGQQLFVPGLDPNAKPGNFGYGDHTHAVPATPTTPAPKLGSCIDDLPLMLPGIAGCEESKKEAGCIAKAICNTWHNNSCWALPWSDKKRGYMCYEWAIAFEHAAEGECSKKFNPNTGKPENQYFIITLESCCNKDGSHGHCWVKIYCRETKKVIYCDDGFHSGYVHTGQPCPQGSLTSRSCDVDWTEKYNGTPLNVPCPCDSNNNKLPPIELEPKSKCLPPGTLTVVPGTACPIYYPDR